MIKFLTKQRASSVLGLSFDGARLEGVVVRRSVTSLQTKETVAATMALSPLAGDPELVGQEIRNHLDQAGIRERRCVVSIPVSWVLTVQTKLPDLPEADLESLLQIEAERGFTSGHENLFIVNSRSKAPGGENYATLIGVPRNHLDNLEKALRAAQLKPVSFSLGISALDGSRGDSSHGAMTLGVGSNTLELEVSQDGGIVALRSLEGNIEAAVAQKHIDSDAVARDIRVTLGQLPTPLGESIRTVRIFARGEMARQFVGEITARLQTMGLRVDTADRASAAEFGTAPSAEFALSPALAVAANYVRGVLSGPELLPPKVSPLQQWMASNIATRKLGWAGAAAVGVAACVAGLFFYQQVQLTAWSARLNKLEPEAKVVRDARKQMLNYEPWFDETYSGLRIIKTITEKFPESGVVSAKSLQIRNLTDVTCTGIAQDNREYFAMITRLRGAQGITNINNGPMIGNPPNVQFSFTLQWMGGESAE